MHEATHPQDLIYALLGLAIGLKKLTYVTTSVLNTPTSRQLDCSSRKAIRKPCFRSSRTFRVKLSFPTPFLHKLMIGRPGAYLHLANVRLADIHSRHYALKSSRAWSARGAISLRGRKCGYVTATSYSFSAVASAAGITQQVIQTGNIYPQPPSAREKQTFGEQICREYHQLHVNVPIADTEKLIHESALPIAPFWIWWIEWAPELWSFAMMNLCQQYDRKVLNSVLELLLRKDSTDFKGLATARNLHDLIDAHFR